MSYLKGFAVIATLGSLAEQDALASTSSTLSLSAETEDVTTKEDVNTAKTALNKNLEVTTTSASLSMEGYCKGNEDVLGTMDIGADVECQFQTGKRKYSFTGIITSLEFTGAKDSPAGYSLTIENKGAITKTVVS